MLKKAAWVLAGLFLLTAFAIAQDEEEERFDFSVGASGVLSSTSQGNGIKLAPTQSLGALITVRWKVGERGALAFNYGRAKNSQIYTVAPFVYRIPADVTEISGAYVFMPWQHKKLHPFLLAGAGALIFGPTDTLINGTSTPAGAVRQTSLAFIYGGGADYDIFSRFSLRLQYRGLIYKAPDFDVPAVTTSARAHVAAPSVGIVVKF